MKKKLIFLLPVFFVFTVFTWLVADNFFFWDTVKLVSVPAHFFYENNFKQLILSVQYDTGHIPGLALYLAVIWKVFFKSLAISHFAMLPFVFGVIWQGYSLVSRYFSNQKYVFIVLFLALLDPTFLSQALMISPDIPLLFFFLLGLHMLSKQRGLFFLLAVVGLIFMSSRGVILVGVLVGIDVFIYQKYSNLRSLIAQLAKKSIKYMPGLLVFIAYQFYHYKTTGWILSHEDSPWASGRVLNSFGGAIYNSGIFVWRIVDFGRVFICIPMLFLFFKYRQRIFSDKKLKHYFILLMILLGSFLVLFMRYKYLTGHRYLLPIYFLLSIFTGYLIVEYVKSKRLKNSIFAFLFIGLLTGNLWVYPNKIAQGWDSSLARLPYYSLQKKMLNYLETENISIEQVGSEFPNLGEQRYIMLNDNHLAFKKKEVGKDNYVLYSNINNDFTDEEIDLLASSYTLIKEFESFHVFVRLYKKT